MASELEELVAKARQLADVASGRVEGDRGARLADRLDAGRFLISVVGEFKRGKSTLLNALLGEAVVPTGVLPLTAVATELAFGEPTAVVELLDGTRTPIGRDEIADYVTEERNPDNVRYAARVEIRGRWPLLASGAVLVDTPGIGSVHRHNTETAQAALLDADGAILVMSADAPVSQLERDVLAVLAERRSPTFYVLNKSDHLTADELDHVGRFVAQVLCDVVGRKVRVFRTSARAALGARLAGTGLPAEAGDFGALVAELERFLDEDLVQTRLSTARAELARLGSSLRDTLALEVAAADLDAATLAAHVERFATEASRQRSMFDDDRTLLERDVTRLGEDLWARLSTFATRAGPGHDRRLEQVAATASRTELVTALRAEVEAGVRSSFEEFRQAEADRTEAAWQHLAEEFRRRTQDRVNAVREAAASLFEVPLPDVRVPPVAEERERFFFLFLHVGGFSDPFAGVLGRLTPEGVARRRALDRAKAELRSEFDKHAGRARWDLTQRLAEVQRRFEATMRSELEATIDAIAAAAGRAEQRRAEDESARADRAGERRLQLAIASELAALARGTE